MSDNPYQPPEDPPYEATSQKKRRRGWKENCLGGLKAAVTGLSGVLVILGLKWQFFPVTPPAIMDLVLLIFGVMFYTGALIAIVAGLGWLIASLLRAMRS
jgi:hypothetical protein